MVVKILNGTAGKQMLEIFRGRTRIVCVQGILGSGGRVSGEDGDGRVKFEVQVINPVNTRVESPKCGGKRDGPRRRDGRWKGGGS